MLEALPEVGATPPDHLTVTLLDCPSTKTLLTLNAFAPLVTKTAIETVLPTGTETKPLSTTLPLADALDV